MGDIAPDVFVQTMSDWQQREYEAPKGKYLLLSFWASYDAPSRMLNASLSSALRGSAQDNVEMVSVSFDEYRSVFEETVRKDQIVGAACFVETAGEDSELYKEFHLNRVFANYLLDDSGVIVAKNISATELSAYLD